MNYKKQWDILAKSVQKDRLPHALLFHGQKGIGKRDFAVNFAKHILGDKKENIHPDFILLDSVGQVKIGQIKELVAKLLFKPYSSVCKIAIINNAHLMNKEAQNCFLKFLEEPPSKTYLILITQYPNLLLPTILSRVQKIRFYPPKNFQPEENEEHFSKIIKISQSSLSERFKIAKELKEDNLEELLDEWILYFRKILLQKLNKKNSSELGDYSLKKIKDIIEEIQKIKLIISSTNTNPQLALEILFLKI